MKYKITNGAVTLDGNTILEEINFEINSIDKIGIVGRNGAGKTTLLNSLIDNELLEEGIGEEKFNITKIGKFNISCLKQIDFENEEITMLDELLKSFKDMINMENKINDLSNKLDNENNIKKYTELQEQFKLLGGYSYKKEYEVMIHKFGFSEEDKYTKINEISGGQKTKIAFMKLLLSKPDVLLLDEPTNHLDIETIEWLEEYLKAYKKAVVIVSHDRMFLDNIVSIIYDIDYGKTYRYVGNYSKFEILKEEKYNKELKDYEYQQKEIKRLTEIYERFRNKPTKAKMALSKLRQIERMDILEKPNKIDLNTFKTNLDEMEPSVKKVVEIKDLVIGYDKPLQTITLDIMRGKKIGVIGKNGIGKSTFLKTLNGIIDPIDGYLSYGLRVKPGYFDQTLAMESSDNTVLQEFMSYHPELTEGISRSALGSFLFKGDDVFKEINVLSGGEKVRLELCKILYDKPNFLILDEPTNHMDIVGKEHLEEILTNYIGTVIFVSHDRYLVKKIADELLVFTDDGVEYYQYGYDEYLRIQKNKKIEQEEIEKNKDKPKKDIKEVVLNVQKVNTYELKKELKKLENEIINLEVKIKKLNDELYKEEVYNDFNKSNEINNKINKHKEELEVLNNKWEEIMNQLV